METLHVFANESTAALRRVAFDVRYMQDLGAGPITGATGQPQISTDGAAWTNTGISTITEIGNGRYYADLTQAAVDTVGKVIRTRYSTTDSDECVGSTVQVVATTATTAATIFSTSLGSESYAMDGSVPTLAQALFGLITIVSEFSISGTTITCKKLDGTTTSMTFTLNDATTPTSRTRVS